LLDSLLQEMKIFPICNICARYFATNSKLFMLKKGECVTVKKIITQDPKLVAH